MGAALFRSLIGDKKPEGHVWAHLVKVIPIAVITGFRYLIAGFFDQNLF